MQENKRRRCLYFGRVERVFEQDVCIEQGLFLHKNVKFQCLLLKFWVFFGAERCGGEKGADGPAGRGDQRPSRLVVVFCKNG